ncbi:MAG: diguanylate cyclase [Kiritimatiellae bacterium]|nr:diguanylate cyclase [Kiritimatiellia bacterium]MCO5061845.1 diguanylate cyclase [Kiritimatiellia bacterium]MCO6401317.1 diguanylate cyclase [Verrucomicrobiota bacterium]
MNRNAVEIDDVASRRLQNIRVLVLDDEEPVRRLIELLLTRHGCIVETADDGREGLRILLQKDFDVAVVDLRMRDMGGSSFLEQARSVWPWLGVVVLTGFADDKAVAHARRYGVTRILAKPMNAEELLRSVLEEAIEKKELVEMSASHNLDRIQAQLSLLRTFSESALTAENLDEALRSLSAGLGSLLPCAAAGILNLEGDEPVLHLHAITPVAHDFLLSTEKEILRRYEALSGHIAPRANLRVIFDPSNLDPQGPQRVGSSFSVPIIARGEIRGMLTLAAVAEDAYSSRDASFLYHAANQLSTVLSALARMRELSVRDALTGLYNRRGLEEEYQRTWLMSRRYNWPVGVAVLDVDDFKTLNDTHGHMLGDQILREFASLVERVARESDIIGRYGGDEMVVILAQAGTADCIAFGERLLNAMRQHVFGTSKGFAIQLTASIGVASSVNCPPDTTSDTLLAQADQALYMAKKSGRNRVSVYQPLPAPAGESSEIPTPPIANGTRKRGNILVVDDEPTVGAFLSRALRAQAYEVQVETTAPAAIAAIQDQPGRFDIIITDLNLPGKSGLDLLDELRSMDENMIKIVITGNATIDNAVLSLRRGAYDFIEKPVVPDQLTAIVERALEYRRLKDENIRYQNHLEEMVREKSAALREALTQIKSSYDFTLEAMASLLDARERSTARHCSRVRDLSVIMARELGLSINEIDEIARGALLHDIGKMSIPDSILLKPGPLTPEEREEMKRHPEAGYQLLSPSPHLKKVAEIIRSHHERYDGTGYPRGLKGTDIPLGARIFAIIDSYDAMRSDRIYRKAVSKEEAMREIERHAGTQFDPALVEAFKRLHLAIEAAGNWDTLESA